MTRRNIDQSDIFDNATSNKKIRTKKQKGGQIYQREIEINLKTVVPLTNTQKQVFTEYDAGQNIVLHGYAGTGKSFISCYLGLKSVLKQEHSKLLIIRSTVPSRNQGFLPGTKSEKAQIYEMPYYGIFSAILNRKDAYDLLKKQGKLEFESTSYLRGSTLDDCVIIFDEFQNCAKNELISVLTRIGDNCRIIISGDYFQSDLDKEKNDVLEIIKILKKMKSVSFIEFGVDDIVRSEFVKEFLIREREFRLNSKEILKEKN